MKIVDLSSSDDLSISAHLLRNKVSNDGYYPDLVVGIPTGGELVLKLMYSSDEIEMLLLKKQRATTRVKKKLKVAPFLLYLPTRYKDFLRKVEHYFHRASFAIKKARGRVVVDELKISEDKKNLIRKSEKILVVDDAVDSGITMRTVFNTVIGINPTCDIRTCCINKTFPNPEINPDYVLYDNVLVRYPWAMDAACKGE